MSVSLNLYDIYLNLGSRVVTFFERVAHLVNCMLSLLCLFVALVVAQFCFNGGILVLFSTVPGHCLPFFTFRSKNHVQTAWIRC